MAVLVHVLPHGLGKDTLRVAFYYPVPDDIYSEASVDPKRTGASDALSRKQLADLREGRIVEDLATIDVTDLTRRQVRDLLEKKYEFRKVVVLDQYAQSYPSIIDASWDGEQWEHPRQSF